MTPEKIDLVYLWVNGNDPEWQAKRNSTIGATDNSSQNCKGRYADNNELMYSLRSVAKYAPWINRIFIVTDRQVPEWLDTSNPKIRIVDHSEILPPESLPCFNSIVLEHFLHRIPGLSEHFLYANDDTMINGPVTPSFFFAPDGLPYFRMAHHRRFRKLFCWVRANIQRRPLNQYAQVIENSSRLAERKFGRYISWKSHHNIDAYLKSENARIHELCIDELRPTFTNHIRRRNDFDRHLYTYASLIEGKGHAMFVDLSTSFHVWIHRPDHYRLLSEKNPTLFCMNDSEFASDADRDRAARFLALRFPDKSPFEL